MGIDNRDEDGGQKQQGGTRGSGSEGGRLVNNPDKSNNANGQHERGSGRGDQADQDRTTAEQKQRQNSQNR